MNETTWVVTVKVIVHNTHSAVEALAVVGGGLCSIFAEYTLCDAVKVSSGEWGFPVTTDGKHESELHL